MLSINTNISSLIAQNSLNQSTNKLNQAIERMTTGAKINHAKDNAANYSISTNMTTKIGAYKVAEDNVAMGMDMVSTASENLDQMQNHATRLRALATQARNGTYGTQSLEAIQAEANAITKEIERLYNTAQYNGVSLFNQSEYDIPDNMPKADPITGFIENPYDYTEEDLKNIESISKVTDSFTESEYKIETVNDLAKLAKLTNDGVDTTGVTFVLANDLDLKEYCEDHKDEGGWTPIGTEVNPFAGNFNGNGNIVSNIIINRSADNQGMFGYTKRNSNSIIRNLGLRDIDINANISVGGLIGYGYSKVDNVFAEGRIQGKNNSGLLCGYNGYSRIANCYTEGDIIAPSGTWIGGLIGSCWSDVENCYSNCNIIGAKAVGGLLGHSSSKLIINCYSNSNLNVNNYGGGFIGNTSTQYADCNITNCISYTKISDNSSTNITSFIGRIYNAKDYVPQYEIQITNCSALEQDIAMIYGTYTGLSSGGESVQYDYDMSTILAGIKGINLKNTNTNLQVGTKDESSSQISFNTNFELDIGKIVRNGIGSDSALNTIDDFINTLSEKSTMLGSVSNSLDSVLDEITIQYENLVSSRSTIRDVDMAEVSSTYIQQQILQEASATLLATTKNIQYQNVLGLLQSLRS